MPYFRKTRGSRKVCALTMAALFVASTFMISLNAQPAAAGWWEDNFEVHGFVTSKAYFRTSGFRQTPQLTSWRSEVNLEWEARLYDNMDTRVALYGVVRPIYDAIYELRDDCYGDDIDDDYFKTFGLGTANAEASGRGDDVLTNTGGRSSVGCQIKGERTVVNNDFGTIYGFGPTATVLLENEVFFGGVYGAIEAVGPNQPKSGGNPTLADYYKSFDEGFVAPGVPVSAIAGAMLDSLEMAGDDPVNAGIGAVFSDGDPTSIANEWARLNFQYKGGVGDRGSLKRGSADINRRESNLAYECGDNAHPWCFVRELYLEVEHKDTFVRFGKQQIVWGKTDAFRLQDRINPLDFGYHSIFADLEERRIPQLALDVIHSFGNVGLFQDVSLEFVWVFDRHIGVQVGQCGEPYDFAGACEARADAGGHGLLDNSLAAVDEIDWTFKNTEPGIRLEFRIPKPSISFSLSAFWNFQDIPIVRAENLASTDNPSSAKFLLMQMLNLGAAFGNPIAPFDPLARDASIPGVRANGGTANISRPAVGSTFETEWNAYLATWEAAVTATCAGGQNLGQGELAQCANPFAIGALPWTGSSFIVEYPRVLTLGGSLDYQIPGIDTILRFELSYDFDRGFINSDKDDYNDESDYFQLSIGLDRSTFIPFLNKNRTAFLSFQTFIAHITDYDDGRGSGSGMIDYETNVISTFFMENYWRNDTIILTSVAAVDWNAGAWTIFPRLRYVMNENWFFDVGVNLIWGNEREHEIRDLCDHGGLGSEADIGTGTCNVFEPDTWQAGAWQNWTENYAPKAEAPWWGQESFADKFWSNRDEFWFGFTYQW